MIKKPNTDSIEQALLRSLTGYTVDSAEGESIINGTFVFQPEFPCFQGHFPDQAILPGIIQMAAVRLLATKAIKQRLVPVAAERIKFRGSIQPKEQISITINLKRHQTTWRAIFSISHEMETIATGRIDFCEDTDSLGGV